MSLKNQAETIIRKKANISRLKVEIAMKKVKMKEKLELKKVKMRNKRK